MSCEHLPFMIKRNVDITNLAPIFNGICANGIYNA